MNIFTIGFAQKNAEEFFALLMHSKVDCLIDVRLNNISQLAGFTKSKDLQYFLKAIANIDYKHSIIYAPTKDILDNYKKGRLSWEGYTDLYNELIAKRRVENDFLSDSNGYHNICLLCSEPTPENCHRRLLAEYLQEHIDDINIIHL